MSWWRNLTYGPRDVFLMLMSANEYTQKQDIPDLDGGGGVAAVGSELELVEIPSTFGRCYTTHFVDPVHKGVAGVAWLYNNKSYGE